MHFLITKAHSAQPSIGLLQKQQVSDNLCPTSTGDQQQRGMFPKAALTADGAESLSPNVETINVQQKRGVFVRDKPFEDSVS